jgi:hypothetical protein
MCMRANFESDEIEWYLLRSILRPSGEPEGFCMITDFPRFCAV